MRPFTTATPPRLVLVVDDDDDIREVAATALELVAGHRTVTATNGLEALRSARQHRPDAILLDVRMPVLDGLETVRMLRQHADTAHIPVILLTASVDGPVPAREISGVIDKPFDPMALGAQISKLLGWGP